MNPDIDENNKVRIVIDDHFSDGTETVNFNQFKEFMDQLEQVGWRKKPKVKHIDKSENNLKNKMISRRSKYLMLTSKKSLEL